MGINLHKSGGHLRVTKNITGTQDNVSQLVEGCSQWETLVNTENSLCTQENLCIGQNIF